MTNIIKIAGGKTKLLPVLMQHLPDTQNLSTYVEPFFGGGALFFHLKKTKLSIFKEYVLNDLNSDIYNLMETVKYSPEDLMLALDSRKITHESNNKECYNNIRSNFGKYTVIAPNICRAANFLYLNKTCFNGLIRYNAGGIFNSPMGKYDNPTLYTKESILEGSLALKRSKMYNCDFDTLLSTLSRKNKLNNRTFIYLDSPYIPESITSNFTSYTSNGFSTYDHHRLKSSVDYLNKIGCNILMSNSDTPLTRELYKNYTLIEVTNKRSIGCKTSSRGDKKELLVKNY
jgi:DNA adenine methylase